MCALLGLFAVLPTGCREVASPVNQTTASTDKRQDSASGMDHQTSPLRAPFADRSIAGRAIRVYTIESLSGFEELDRVAIHRGVNFSWASKNGLPIPTEAMLASLIVSSSPVPPDSPQLEAWHYAPWFDATFVSKEREWSLDMYLGGLGFLTDSSGKTAALLWTQVDDGSEQTHAPEPAAGPVSNGELSPLAR